MNERDPARTDRMIIAIGGVVLCLISLAVFVAELTPPWAEAQDHVHAVVARTLGAEQADGLPTGLQQIWIPELSRVDRCVSCHTTTGFGEALAGESVPHPARSHPHPALLAAHPVERFGCTLCHGGQGQATTQAAAHGNVPHWEEPLLDTTRAGRFGLTRAELMELRCAICHQTIEPVEGMPFLNEMKDKLFDCIDCHQLPGFEPGKAPTAPDLRSEGEKHPSNYHFPDGWSGATSALRWHVEHFLDPKAMTPNSPMGRFAANPREAAGLALLVLSWQRQQLPAAWIPKSK